MDLTLQQLRMLREVASHGTIAAAAESMGYTPSAVSQQLSALERALDHAVLRRVGRNVQLTDAGRVLVRHAIELLDGVEAARVAVEQSSTEVCGELLLTVYESVAATLLPAALSLLAERYPDLHVRTRQMDPDVAIDALTRGDADLAFAIHYPHAPEAVRDDVVRTAVVSDRFRLAVPVDDPIRGPSVELSSLAGRKTIASPTHASCGRCVMVACRAAGFEPDVVHELDDYPTALRLVAGGHGISMIPDLGLEDVPAGVRIVDIEPSVTRTIQLASRRSSADRPAIAAVIDAVADVVAARRSAPRLVG